MKQQRFSFTHNMVFSNAMQGEVRFEGVVYRDEDKGFDIDGIHFKGADILPVLNWLGEGSVNEVDKVYNIVNAHCEYVRENWNEYPREFTDLAQDEQAVEILSPSKNAA